MTLNLRMVLEADSGAAKAALDDTARGIKTVTAATTEQASKSKAAATAADAEAAAKRRNAQASTSMANANRSAAGATGNLVAQLNDVGMMLAAGQNPLQLAIQQGTQITQVIGPMGAAGAASALGTAFMGLLSPINLVTLGIIAAAGYTVRWLTDAAEDTMSFADSVDELARRADAYVEASKRARMSTSELRGEFGDSSVEIRKLLKDMAELELRETQRAARQTSDSLQSQIGIFDGPEFGVGNQKNLADMFDLSIWSEAARKEINTVLRAFEQLDSAGTLDEQIAAAENLKARFTEAAMASGEISAAEDAVIAPLNQMIATLIRVRGEQAGLTEDVGRTKDEATNLVAIAGEISSTIQSADGSQLVAAFAAAFPTARALFGITQGIVGMLGSFDYGALGDDERGSQREGLRSAGEWKSRQAVMARLASMGKSAGGGGGGGAAAARDEADALQELIDSLNGEIEALRVQDPIQKEMLQHRKALEGATEAERQKIEELIATREREKAQLEQIEELEDFRNDLIDNALEALIVKGESLQDVLKGVIAALAKAAIQAAIFGEGPLGSIFGGVGIGELLFGGGKAEGGMVYGPGTATSDSILTPLSNGEYVVNARATARNRHLLEAINAGGSVRGFAEGGYVGADNRRMGARGEGGGGGPTFNINLAGARGDREIEEAAHKGMKRALEEYDRDSLPGSVKRISRDQKRLG